MGQVTTPVINVASSITVPTTTSSKPVGAGYMGEFGSGLWRVFYTSGTFIVPSGVTKIRVRVLGGGGGGRQNGAGAAGGGYAHGVFTVAPLTSYAVTVGAAGVGHATAPTAGGSSSFGALISATGGGAAIAGGGAVGGTGTGGNFQASGGTVGASAAYGGGTASGSQLGNGGTCLDYAGAGVGNGTSRNRAGGSAFGEAFTNSLGQQAGPDILGARANGTAGSNNPINATIRFPFDGFTGGGGAPVDSGHGGFGAGGGAVATISGHGKFGGGGAGTTTGSGTAGSSDFGGGGGSTGGAGGTPGNGGQGLVIVEW